jgi:zinc protease
MQNSYLEISIVGDFDPSPTEAALAAVFGTLPPRAPQRADYSAALNVHFPTASEGQVKTFTVPSVIPKAEAVDFWPTTDMSDFQRASAIDVLAEIFSDRLRVQVRQKLGQAYSPYAYNDSSEIYPAYGYTMSLITAEPKLAASLGDLARTIADDLTSGNITPDEFNRAITPLRLALPETFRKNNYWLLSVLAGSQAFPQRLDWARALPTVYDKITLDQVKALAKVYFGAGHAVRILVLPEAPETVPVPPNATTSTP